MKYWSFFVLSLVLIGCINHETKSVPSADVVNRCDTVIINYAKGFTVAYHSDYIKIKTQSFGANEPFKDSLYILQTQNRVVLPQNVKVLDQELKTVACQSSTHLAYLDKINKLDVVKGICGLKYVNDSEIKATLTTNLVQEICLADRMEQETVLALHPDLLFTYPFGANLEDNFSEKGINTLLIAAYLEQSQLARLEWIKLFGLLFNQEQLANAYFEEVKEQYVNLKIGGTQNKEQRFILNLPFKDNWFMPSSNSVTVELITDAGLDYFYKEDAGTENNLHSKEEVWEDGTVADYWIIVAERPLSFTLADLVAEEPAYAAFKSVKNGNVIFCNTAQVDYFAKGVVEPHLILKDLLFATGKLSNYKPTYFFRLE